MSLGNHDTCLQCCSLSEFYTDTCLLDPEVAASSYKNDFLWIDMWISKNIIIFNFFCIMILFQDVLLTTKAKINCRVSESTFGSITYINWRFPVFPNSVIFNDPKGSCSLCEEKSIPESWTLSWVTLDWWSWTFYFSPFRKT